MQLTATVFMICAALAYGEKDGYREIAKATNFGKDGKFAEGEAYIADLRKRPRKDLSPVEIQAEDMAEFALYRRDESRRDDCVKILRKVHGQGPETIWGWAAAGFLDDFKALDQITLPKRDPYLHLGEIAHGVLGVEPKELVPDKKGTSAIGKAERLLAQEKRLLPKANPDPETLKPGSETRRAILRTHLVELCGPGEIDRLLGMEGGEKLFARLWNDDAALEGFLLSGPVFAPPYALEVLMTFYLNDENGFASSEEGRKITVACAVNAKRPDRKKDPHKELAFRFRHYAAFRRLSERKLFHESTAKRDVREWRFIVPYPKEAQDFLYLNSRPYDYKRPGAMIYRIPYRTYNCFGDSIFGSSYFRPWRLSDWPGWYLTHRVGGVCGLQSLCGAVSSMAHGLMAQTAGQPNHCAWLLRDEDGCWNIKNNINKYTAGVFLLWGRGYQYVQATERAFKNREAWDRSELVRFLAAHEAVAETRPNAKLREKLLHMAISHCPYNLSAWRDYTDYLKARKADAGTWGHYLDVLCKSTPNGRTATWDFAFEALDEMRKAGVRDEALAEKAVSAVASLPEPKERIGEEMNYRGVVLKRLASMFKSRTDLQEKVLAAGLDANWGSKNYFSQILQQGVEAFADDPKASERFFSDFARISKARASEGEGLTAKGLNFRDLLRAASEQRQREAFQTLADLRNRLDPPPKGKAYPDRDFDARLLSHRGLLHTSGRGKGDAPQDYPRVIDASPIRAKRPYQIAMKPTDDPWAIVELRGQCKISGVAVTGDKMERLTVAVSEDGRDWKTLFADEGAAKETVRADFRGKRPQAKFVRIGRVKDASAEQLKLSKILVYGDTLY